MKENIYIYFSSIHRLGLSKGLYIHPTSKLLLRREGYLPSYTAFNLLPALHQTVTQNISFKPYKFSFEVSINVFFIDTKDQRLKKKKNLPKVTQPVSNKAGIKMQVGPQPKPCSPSLYILLHQPSLPPTHSFS